MFPPISLETVINSSLQPRCRRQAHHTFVSSPDTGKSEAGRLGSSPRAGEEETSAKAKTRRQILQRSDQSVRPTSGASGSATTQRAGRRQPGQPQRTWHDGQRTAESSSSGLRNMRGFSAAPAIHRKFTDARAGPETKACGLPAHPPSTKTPAALWQGGEVPYFILPWISPSNIPASSINGNFPKSFAKLRTLPACCRWGSGAQERSHDWLRPTRGTWRRRGD